MSPPKKKRKTKKPSSTLGSYSISSLPDDLVLSCLARVSRSYYPILSLVSKKFRSLIASPQLYSIRSLLGRAESCLYVCLKISDFDSRWFTLCQRPNKKKEKQSLVPIPFPDSPQAKWSNVVTIGFNIYFIGGLINDEPTSNVSILDCRSHTWHQAPNFQARRSLAVNVIDEKIYVVGRPVNNNSSWVEVFDPKTHTWNSLSGQKSMICGGRLIGSIEIDGKIFMRTSIGKDVSYNPKDDTFEPSEWDMFGWFCDSHCVVYNNLLLCYYHHGKVFNWFDTKARLWRDLKGLEGIKRKIAKGSRVRLADYGGRIAVFWDKCSSSKGCEEKMIWFAEISLERRRNDEEEIWGRVEFVDCVLTVPWSYNVWKAVSATL